MASTAQELTRRLEMTTPTDTIRGLAFNAILKLVQERLGPDVAQELLRPLFRRPPLDFLAYPARDFLRLLYAAAEVLEPCYGSAEAALRGIGRETVRGFLGSGVGRTLLSITGLKDTRRIFSNAPTAYATVVSYGSRQLTELGPQRLRLTFEGDMQPVPYHEGILDGALAAIGASGTVRGTPLGEMSAEYVVEWA
jgi:uncharacterized protein (TIGR02265 family)